MATEAAKEGRMAIEVRRNRDIHRAGGGWFHARWHFSFDHYRDPGPMGVGRAGVPSRRRLGDEALSGRGR